MGSYSYCYKCAVLLRDKDFAKGKAFRIGANVSCDKCAVDLTPDGVAPTPPPKTETRARAKPSQKTSTKVRAVEPPPEEEEVDVPPRGKRRLLIAGGAGLLLAVLAIVLLLSLTGRREIPPGPAVVVPATAAPTPGAETLKIPPKEVGAREALEAARRIAKEKPDHLQAQARALEEVAWTWEGTAASGEASRELEAVRIKMKEAAAVALAALDVELAGPLAREEIGTVIDLLEAAARRLEAPAWIAGLSARRGDLESKARQLLAGLVKQAVQHKLKGEKVEIDKLAARIETWKLPLLLATFREELDSIVVATPVPGPAAAVPPAAATLPVEAKPRSPEGAAYLDAWKAAVVKATARDHAGAQLDLKKSMGTLQEEDVRKEAEGDASDLKALGDLYQAILAVACALPVGKPCSVEVRGTEGPRRLAGVVVRNGKDRAELRTGRGPVFVEWGDATPSGLAGIPRSRKPEEPRLFALWSLLEGDLEGAKAFLAGKFDQLTPKVWAYASETKGKLAAPPREELQARDLYYAAEREFGSMESRGPAVEKYRTLRNDLATSSLVRGELDRILRRSEAGKEYLLTAADARISGTVKRSKDGPAVSAKDSDAQEAAENACEVEFYALPGTSYRAWLHLGGCCREVFSFFLQGTEMTASDKGRKIQIEPGSDRAEFVPSSLISVKKEHKDHAKNKEPKSPARWEWVPLQLPKYATPGLKKIRLMTAQQGFGVQQVLVSSTRNAAPKPPELEELQKARAVEVAPVVADPDLVLHWTFDEADGAFEDLTGNGFAGTSTGVVKRGPGRMGGAAVFDSKAGHVAGKDAPELRITGDLTIAFWVRKDAEIGDWVRLFGKGTGEKRNYGVWEEPGDGKKVLWQIYKDSGGAMVSMQSNRTLEIGKWHHVACLRRGKLAVIYIDGRKDAEAACEGIPATMNDPVTAGHGLGAGHSTLTGALDDIRLYRRALSDEEIGVLFESGQ